ncbi:hypothetical protein H5410_046725 [Solanum commersonii]|uniref:Uncharacterized protein n=1 Tax=Solanum commersonii TaxID=4109 RepID=A0A9J5XD24_SOLCO|nr:hypothetical protein H5410_046725 [Solanum commersonii]
MHVGQLAPLIYRIVARISSWTTKKISYTGTNTITKRNIIAWDEMCLAKPVGGLNLINPINMEQGRNKKDIWIHNFYIMNHYIISAPLPQDASRMVKKIIVAKSLLEKTQLI